jgi:hypothetical protein
MIWASRFASLASGYPLHHLLHSRAHQRCAAPISQVVPLLSLSQKKKRHTIFTMAWRFRMSKKQIMLQKYPTNY